MESVLHPFAPGSALFSQTGCIKHYYQTPTNGYDVPDNKTNETRMAQPLICKRIYTMNDHFHREDERIKTFAQWPHVWLDKKMLARTGMFFTGEADKVKCYFCEVEIGRWEEEDLPVPEHLRWSPNCPLLRRRTTNNVPIDFEALDAILPPISYDLCGANNSIEEHAEYATEDVAPSSTSVNNTPASSVVANYFPEFPEYAIEAARLRSYAEWPRHMKQTPEMLSEAGFFYTGVGDRVKCFSCGGGLKDWDTDDQPFEQHALWLNKCRYLQLIKGASYVESVAAKYKTRNLGANAVVVANADMAKQQQPLADSASTTTPSNCYASEATTAAAAPSTTAVAVSAAATEKALIAPTATLAESEACTNAAATNAANIAEEKLCKICYADEYNTAFLPCGHVVACAKCASSVTKCPLCRKPFTNVMRVYFS